MLFSTMYPAIPSGIEEAAEIMRRNKKLFPVKPYDDDKPKVLAVLPITNA